MTILAIDLETTGLNAKEDYILEVAWQVLDDHMVQQTETNSFLVEMNSDAALKVQTNEYVLNMHRESGLWDDLLNSAVLHVDDVEDMLLRELDEADGPVYLLGNSVHFDRSFIDSWMPRLSKKLSHRIIDATTLRLVLASVGAELELPPLNKHRAKDDIEASIWYVHQVRSILGHGLEP
jgi:oligoribonuclease